MFTSRFSTTCDLFPLQLKFSVFTATLRTIVQYCIFSQLTNHTGDQHAENILEWACVAEEFGAEQDGRSGSWGEPQRGDVGEMLPSYSVGHRGQLRCSQGDAENLRPG